MKIAYLMNSYPMVSSTFIGREMAGLERAGFTIDRYAFRRWDGQLVDPADEAELAKTDYLLDDGVLGLCTGFLGEACVNPRGVVRAAKLWWRLYRAGGGFVRHTAYLLEAVALRRRLHKTPVAHIHAHFSTNAAAVAMMTKALGGPGYSFTVHGPDELFDPEGNSLGLKISQADFVACISHFCRSQCMIFAPVDAWGKLRIVLCGVRVTDYAVAPPAADLPAGGAGGRVLYVGRLSQLKGGLVLIEALALLGQTHPDADLVVVGDGEVRARMQARAQALGMEGRVHFLGFRSQGDVRAAMADADIFTLPSFAEGVPVVFMEAMASGKPVVATQIAGVSELVEDGVSGFVVPPGDVDALAERLGQLLDDTALRDRMGIAGQKQISAEFNIDVETDWLGDLISGAGSDKGVPEGLRPQPDGHTPL